MKTTWPNLKSFIDNNNASFRYVELDSEYWIIASDSYFKLECFIDKIDSDDSAYKTDFETNYISLSNKTNIDISGRQIIRPAATEAGWTYLASFLEVNLGATTTLRLKDYKGNDRYTSTIKHYDAFTGGNEVVPANYLTNAVRTEITFRGISDYDIISGAVINQTLASQNIWLHFVIGAFHPVTEAELGAKEMVGGMNLKLVSQPFIFDGRASKFLKQDIGVPGVDGNQFRIVLLHDLAATHSFMIEFEYYRE